MGSCLDSLTKESSVKPITIVTSLGYCSEKEVDRNIDSIIHICILKENSWGFISPQDEPLKSRHNSQNTVIKTVN